MQFIHGCGSKMMENNNAAKNSKFGIPLTEDEEPNAKNNASNKMQSSISFFGYHQNVCEESVRISTDCKSAIRLYSFNSGMAVTNRPVLGHCEFIVQVTDAVLSTGRVCKGGIRIGVLLVNKGEEVTLPSSIKEVDYLWGEEKNYSKVGDTHRMSLTNKEGKLSVTYNGDFEDRVEGIDSGSKDVYIVIDHHGTTVATDVIKAVMYHDGLEDRYPLYSSDSNHSYSSHSCPHPDDSTILQLIKDVSNPLMPSMYMSDSLDIITPTDFEVILMPPLEEEMLSCSFPYGKQPNVEESITMRENTELKLEILKLNETMKGLETELVRYKDLYDREVDRHTISKTAMKELEAKIYQLQKLLKVNKFEMTTSV